MRAQPSDGSFSFFLTKTPNAEGSKLVLGGEEEDFREDKSLMLEALAPQLSHEFEKIKKVTQDLVSPMEKLKALLTAKDKKAHISPMLIIELRRI